MKKLFLIVLMLVPGYAFGQTGNATEIRSGPTLPVTCDPTRGWLFWNNNNLTMNTCSALNTWSVLGTGGGSGTPGGSPGQPQYNNAGVFGGFTMAGDCTLVVPNITCTETNGTPFAPSATIDTTNGSNITSGTISKTVLPLPWLYSDLPSTVAQKVISTNNIRYAASNGNDSNDGLSWGTAKLTVMAAYDALPSTGGTVYISGESQFGGGSVINATSTGQGIWLMGSADPNSGSPPTGWRIGKPISFVCASGSAGDQQGARPTCLINSNAALGPAIWLSSMQGSTVNPYFENLSFKYYSTAVQIGVDSTGAKTNTSGVYGASFENVNTKMCNPTCSSGSGPGWLISGGDTSDIFLDHIVASGNGQATAGADNQAAILIQAGSAISGFIIKITNSVMEAGGIKYYEPQGGSTITVHDTYSEGQNGGSVTPGVGVFWAASSGIGSVTTYDIENVFPADTTGNVCGARFDVFAWHEGNISTKNTGVCSNNSIQQGSVVAHNLTNRTGGPDPLTQGLTGVSYGRYYGFIGNTQRQLSPSMVRYQNLANTASSSWTIAGLGGSIATGTTAPDGTTGAATVTATTNTITTTFYSQSLSLAVGQYFIAGLYQRFNTPDDYYDFSGAGTYGLQINIGGSGNTTTCSPLWTPGIATDEWVWVWTLCKVTAAPTTPATVTLTSAAPVVGSHASVLDFYAPMLLNIPASTISNDEVYELANNLVPYSSTCSVGTLCGIAGAPGSGLPTLPTAPNSVPQSLTSTPAGGIGQPALWNLAGVITRPVTGTTSTDTILSADCTQRVNYRGSVAVGVTLPTASTLLVPNCVFSVENNTTGSSTDVTVTPTTWTITKNTTTGLTSLAIHQGDKCTFYVGPSGTVWDAVCLFANVDTPNLGIPSAIDLTNATNTPACATCVVASSPGAGVAHFAGGTQTATSSTVGTADLANNAVTSAKMASVNTRRVCDIVVGDTTGSAITNGQLGPQKRLCYIPAAATVIEMDVAADAGTPNVIVAVDHAGSNSNIVSSALATASSGGIACSNTGGTTGIDGATTCSGTLQNTSVAAGDYLELVSGTAGGTAKLMTVHVIYTIN